MHETKVVWNKKTGVNCNLPVGCSKCIEIKCPIQSRFKPADVILPDDI